MLGPGSDPRLQIPSSSASPAPSSNPVTVSSTVSSMSSMSSQGIMNMTVERAIQNSQVQSSALRLSKVIEDSVRKDVKEEKKSIYAPNSRAPSSVRSGEQSEVMEGLAVPRGNHSPGERRSSSASALPQVEGLAARFDSYFEKEKATSKTEGLAARFSSPDIPQSRPNSTSSKSSLHTPDLTVDESRKRPASPLLSPNPGKKPSRPASSSGEGSAPDEAKRCLDEINMGFDRLVSMASELDKRRKSAENSPQQNNTGSPRKGAADLRLNDASFDPNIMAQKFKAGLMQGERGGGGAPPHSTAASHNDKPPMAAGPSFPGGNLPEHHFKKRYFNEEYQRQQKETERHLDQQRRQEHYERFPGPRPGYHHGEPRTGPGYHLGPRQLHPDQYRHPAGGPGQGYPPNYPNRQVMMMNYRQMMYSRPPHPPQHPPHPQQQQSK